MNDIVNMDVKKEIDNAIGWCIDLLKKNIELGKNQSVNGVTYEVASKGFEYNSSDTIDVIIANEFEEYRG